MIPPLEAAISAPSSSNPGWKRRKKKYTASTRKVASIAEGSRAAQAEQLMSTDLDADACRALLHEAGATTMIHGHTHRPAMHDLGDGLQRVVLSDWDFDAVPPRGDAVRLSAAGLQRLPL